MDGQKKHGDTFDCAQWAPDGGQQNDGSQNREQPGRPRAGAISGMSSSNEQFWVGRNNPKHLEQGALNRLQQLRMTEGTYIVPDRLEEYRTILAICEKNRAMARNDSNRPRAAPAGGIAFKEVDWKAKKTDSKETDSK